MACAPSWDGCAVVCLRALHAAGVAKRMQACTGYELLLSKPCILHLPLKHESSRAASFCQAVRGPVSRPMRSFFVSRTLTQSLFFFRGCIARGLQQRTATEDGLTTWICVRASCLSSGGNDLRANLG